jgi:glutaredoxin
MMRRKKKAKQRRIFEITFKNSGNHLKEKNMNLPILFVKQGCPWCVEALEYFQEIDLSLDIVDVRQSPDKMDELFACSGQGLTPTLKNGDFVVADFDIGEFKQAMLENPEEAKKLGLNS